MLALQNQNILVLGLGASGMAMLRWCVKQGAQVLVSDTRDQPPQLQALREELPGVRFVPASAVASQGIAFDRILRSPGIAPVELEVLLRGLALPGTKIQGELELFSEALHDLAATEAYQPKVIAITGTNGKTTVTALTGQLLQRAGKKVAVAGNIGPNLLDTLTIYLNQCDLPEVWVLELSSFQLDGVQAFEPLAATVLNISQDHLDWHSAMQSYIAAKARIFGTQALMVLNRDDPAVMAMLLSVPKSGRVKNGVQRNYVSFGEGLPLRPGDYGLEVVNRLTWLVRALESDTVGRKRSDPVHEINIQKLLPADALRIRGRHNAVNALAALALAASTGCALGPMLFGLREYAGEPHRLQSLGVIKSVEYFDDSKGTNVGATVAALNGLGVERRLVVIMGGDGKGQDFAPLVAPLVKFARAIVLIGRDAEQIAQVVTGTALTVEYADALEHAVSKASQLAQAGDAVLLSPACASLDMFRSYVHRAEVFAGAVGELAVQSGQMPEVQP